MLKTVSSITNALGALNYKGTWDATANSPTLTSSAGTKGDYYVVGTAGATVLNGISNWGIGDWAVFNGSVWQRVEGGADLNGVNLSASGTVNFSGLTASKAVFTDASKNLTSTGTLAADQGGTGQSSYAVGDVLYASTTSALSKLAGVATGNALISGGVGAAPAYGKIGLTTHVSGTLPTANGGTNLTSFTANGIPYASSTSALATSSFLTWDGITFKAQTNANGINAVVEAASLDPYARGVLMATGSYQTQTSQASLQLRWNDGSTTASLASALVVNEGASAATSGANWRFYTTNSSGVLTESYRISSDQYLLVGYVSSNGAYRLQVNSQIFATSATIATSDGRYKKDVAPLDNALDLVMKLNPVSFNWKQHPVHNFDYSTKTVGYIAQEVRETLKDTPYVNAIVKANQCVIQEKEIDEQTGAVVKEEIREEFLGIAEGNLVALLNRAIQEQQQIITQLAARVAALEANAAP